MSKHLHILSCIIFFLTIPTSLLTSFWPAFRPTYRPTTPKAFRPTFRLTFWPTFRLTFWPTFRLTFWQTFLYKVVCQIEIFGQTLKPNKICEANNWIYSLKICLTGIILDEMFQCRPDMIGQYGRLFMSMRKYLRINIFLSQPNLTLINSSCCLLSQFSVVTCACINLLAGFLARDS